jgi:predicted RNA-binding protein with PIN domain
LQERYAAVSAGIPSSLAGQPAAAAARRSRPSSTAAVATAIVIDGYNFLHYHPTTKQLMSIDQVDQARALLHQLLDLYAAEQKQEVLVVYDATTVSATGEDRVSRVSDNVQIMFRAGHEADNVIITAVRDLHEQHAAAAAAGLPACAAAGRRVVVVTNDKRIQTACSEADLYDGLGGSVFCQGNMQLSRDLQQLENKLARFNKGMKVDNPAAAAAAVTAAAADGRSRPSGVGGAPSIDQDTYAWAMRVLRADRAAASNSISNGSRKQMRHRRQQQQQQQQQVQQVQSPELLLSDEELLLQAKAAAAAAAGRVPSGVVASSTSQTLDELLLEDLDDLV